MHFMFVPDRELSFARSFHAGGDFFEGIKYTIGNDDPMVSTYFRIRPLRTIYSLGINAVSTAMGLGIGGGIGYGVTRLADAVMEKVPQNSQGLVEAIGIIGAIFGPLIIGDLIADTPIAQKGREIRLERKFKRQMRRLVG